MQRTKKTDYSQAGFRVVRLKISTDGGEKNCTSALAMLATFRICAKDRERVMLDGMRGNNESVQ